MNLETEKQFKDLYKTRNLDIAWSILDNYFEGKLSSTAAQDLVTAVNSIVNSKNTEECADILEAIVTVQRTKDPRNPQTWRWASDAQYALRILGEKFGYYPERIEELANQFNKRFADREYSIGRFSYTCPRTKKTLTVDPVQKAA